MIKILITSVGSLVGQNILDALASRRSMLTIVGLNSIAENQRVFRCDKAYLLPLTKDEKSFKKVFIEIVQKEKPDLILAGRDSDVLFLAQYKEENPETGHLIPCGNSALARIMLDKYESARFAMLHGLPFAETILYQGDSDRSVLDHFIERNGLPLVVKPRLGFGSKGVFFLVTPQQVNTWVNRQQEVLFQECLGDRERFDQFKDLYNSGIPIFSQIPETQHYSAQVMISCKGKLLKTIINRCTMVVGRTESIELFQNKEAEKMVISWAETLGAEGWRGFLNIQFKQDRFGNWKVYELNPRMGGASSARLLLGFDELGMVINNFYPELEFPDLSMPLFRDGIVLKCLTDEYIDREDINNLVKKGAWTTQAKQKCNE